MLLTDIRATAHAEVLKRVFDLTGHGLTPTLAEGILELDFPEQDAERLAYLSTKANEGTLSEREHADLEAYVSVGDLLALWQAKARQALHRTA